MLRGNLNPPLTQNSTNPERHGQNLIREPQASGFLGPIYSCGGAHKAKCTSVVRHTPYTFYLQRNSRARGWEQAVW